GFGKSASAAKAPPSRSASARFSSNDAFAAAFIAPISAPAQNEGPRPPSTTTLTASSWASWWNAAPSSLRSSGESALCCSGRLSHTRATGPSRAISIGSGFVISHPEHAELHLGGRGLDRRRKGQRQHVAGLPGLDDAVVPQPRGREVGAPLLLVLVEDRLLELLLLRRRHRLPLRLELRALDLRQYRRRLLAAHDRDPAVGPHEQEPRLGGAAAHAVVPGSEAAADDDSELRHRRVRDRVHHLGPVLRDAAVLVLLPDDIAADVLQEQERDAALGRELDEVGGLERAVTEQH